MPSHHPHTPLRTQNTRAEKPDEKVVALEGLLTALTVQHEKLLGLAERHKAAIATADVLEMHEVIVEQNEAVQKVAELERARAALVAAMGFAPPASAMKTAGKQGVSAASAPPITLSAIAATLNEPARSRLSGAAMKLRTLIERLGHEQRSIRVAAEAVATHLDAIMGQVAQRLSSSGTYARGGTLDKRGPVASSFDIRS